MAPSREPFSNKKITMRWRDRRQSSNVEDRRGIRGRTLAAGGGLGAVIVAVIFLLLGGNPDEVVQQLPTTSFETAAESRPLTADEQEAGRFVSVILADTEDVWGRIFSHNGRSYREPTLVLFTDSTPSACGYAGAASGPFYCPGDEKVYIDLGFFAAMKWDITSRISWGSWIGCGPNRTDSPRGRRTTFWSGWSCRRISWLVSGLTMPNGCSVFSKKATSRRPSTPRPLWETTVSSS